MVCNSGHDGYSLSCHEQKPKNITLIGMNRFYWSYGRMYDQIKLYVYNTEMSLTRSLAASAP